MYSQPSIIKTHGDWAELSGQSRVQIIKNMNINEPRTKLRRVNEISLSNRANVSQPKLNKMQCISFGACEHETRSDLCFEAKQIQSAPKFYHII